jgi:hypothetical protein
MQGSKAPSTKHQAPEKLQAPNPKSELGMVWNLNVEVWSFSGAWILELGA